MSPTTPRPYPCRCPCLYLCLCLCLSLLHPPKVPLFSIFPKFFSSGAPPILFLISPDAGFTGRLSDVQLYQATNPICGLKFTKDCGLEEAVKIFQKNSELGKVDMDGMVFLANMAAGNLSSNPHNLSQDEIAAIHLYTQETPLYRVLNDRLRSEKRELLVPFFPYLKLLLRAMYKLPVIKCSVYRGVTKDLSKNFVSGESYIWWWGLTSTATDIEVRFDFSFSGDHLFHLDPFLKIGSDKRHVLWIRGSEDHVPHQLHFRR